MIGASWFVITRDDDEAYFGAVTTMVVLGSGMLFLTIVNGHLSLLNVLLLVIMVTYLIYLNWSISNHGNFKFVTVQDVTYIINETKTVEEVDRVDYPRYVRYYQT